VSNGEILQGPKTYSRQEQFNNYHHIFIVPVAKT